MKELIKKQDKELENLILENKRTINYSLELKIKLLHTQHQTEIMREMLINKNRKERDNNEL